jgi:hypothetical protein
MSDHLRIRRHECKYLVSETTARAMRASVLPFVAPDAHAAIQPGHSYPIVSLYLDSASLALHRETIEGQLDRFKLRVRSYGDEPAAQVFLEVKRRHDRVVNKLRCPVARLDATALLARHADLAAAALADPRHQRARAEFMRLMLRFDARPTVLVRYDREAYVGAFDPSVRVTFDRRLAAARTERPEVRMQGPAFSVVEGSLVIVELKFDDRCPSWLAAAVQTHGLRRRSYSKYSMSMAATSRRGSAATG